MQIIQELVVRFAEENLWWGYRRIQGAPSEVGYKISNTTVGNILIEHGIPPAPKRPDKSS